MRLENNDYGVARPKCLINPYTNEKLTLYPKISFVRNIGHDDSGTHSRSNHRFLSKDLSQEILLVDNDNAVFENLEARLYIEKYFRSLTKSLFERVYNRLKKSLVQ